MKINVQIEVLIFSNIHHIQAETMNFFFLRASTFKAATITQKSDDVESTSEAPSLII